MSRARSNSAASFEALRSVFSAAHLRELMNLRDTGRVALARVRNALGGQVVDNDGRDLLVHVVDVLSGLPLLARLHVPANMLWRKPRDGETMAVVTPADINSPGGPVALYGDAGGAGAVPPWVDTKSGLYTDETVRIESANHDVEVHVKDGQQVRVGAAATKKVNREGDPIDPGSLSVATGPPVVVGPVTTTPVIITYTPPGGAPQVVTLTIGGPGVAVALVGSGSITLGGKTGPGSTKFRAED